MCPLPYPTCPYLSERQPRFGVPARAALLHNKQQGKCAAAQSWQHLLDRAMAPQLYAVKPLIRQSNHVVWFHSFIYSFCGGLYPRLGKSACVHKNEEMRV
uniref:Uncharacterized protein n=1 Tax=Eutreptiella gymnastica TaxID=73025 RepID=A0A7S4FQN4_9EUGL